MQNVHPLHSEPLKFVEFEGKTPMRLIDVGAHIRSVHGDLTLRELYEFAKRKPRDLWVDSVQIKHGRDLDDRLASWTARAMEHGLSHHSMAVLATLFAMTKDPQVELALSHWTEGRYGVRE